MPSLWILTLASMVATKKTTQLRNLLRSSQLECLMEAHNGLSARIVQEAGFPGIWASGLTMSAAMGLRDSNEASYTQVLETVEFMADATTVPILLDADTGYGNFNNVRRLVRKLESRDVAGMCMEDKLFPKTNSFVEGRPQELASVEEFVGKIHAAKDTQRDPDFVVVARVEALIAGWSLEEALRRALAYKEAGADAILIHSKKPNADEILSFMKQWPKECPVVIVPTTYHATPTQTFCDAGVSTVIWANHIMRSAITAMKQTAAAIYRDRSLVAVESQVVSVAEIFRLQGQPELTEAEDRYLPSQHNEGVRRAV